MIISASILDQLDNYYIVFITSIVVMCFTGASNALNDAIDIKSDSINRPNRPISLGKISINSAIFISFILYTSGSIMCLNLPNMAQVIAIIISVPLMIIYNTNLKGLYLTNTKHHSVDVDANNEINNIITAINDLNFEIN